MNRSRLSQRNTGRLEVVDMLAAYPRRTLDVVEVDVAGVGLTPALVFALLVAAAGISWQNVLLWHLTFQAVAAVAAAVAAVAVAEEAVAEEVARLWRNRCVRHLMLF